MSLHPSQQAQDFLAQSQNSDGGWGYRAGSFSVTEPTALALAARPSPAAVKKGVAWLLQTHKEDGGWGMNGQDTESGWMTAWAVWALQAVATDESLAAARRGVEWLQEMPVARTEDPITHGLIGVDPSLAGWAWRPGEGAWVEPTALNVLVLSGAGVSGDPRWQEGVAFLRDRMCLDGGWNVGAPVNFGKQMSATPYHTALTLLALQATGADPEDPVISKSLAVLRQLSTASSVAANSLAWGILALRAWQADVTALSAHLLERQSADGSWEGTSYATAVALLALQEPGTIFARGG